MTVSDWCMIGIEDEDHRAQWTRNYEVRRKAYRQFEAWFREGRFSGEDVGIKGLMKLLGVFNAEQFRKEMTAEHKNTIELLCGPHGWAIYQMLLARNVGKSDAKQHS